MKLNVSECQISGCGHLIDKDKKIVLVQVGHELFFMSQAITVKSPKHLKELLEKYHLVLLKE